MIGKIDKKHSTLKIIFLFATFVGVSMLVYVGCGNYGVNPDYISGREQEEDIYKNGFVSPIFCALVIRVEASKRVVLLSMFK